MLPLLQIFPLSFTKTNYTLQFRKSYRLRQSFFSLRLVHSRPVCHENRDKCTRRPHRPTYRTKSRYIPTEQFALSDSKPRSIHFTARPLPGDRFPVKRSEKNQFSPTAAVRGRRRSRRARLPLRIFPRPWPWPRARGENTRNECFDCLNYTQITSISCGSDPYQAAV